ncbi:MAG: hypothetical protein M1834_003274 [Cirrosporium novae-zelandiae]|nr:MAG: hypothetical protein M1834_003274 [Cirrosporium novae-zelandiae]
MPNAKASAQFHQGVYRLKKNWNPKNEAKFSSSEPSSSIEPPVSELPSSESPQIPTFTFVANNGPSTSPASMDRKRIRAHVMRDYKRKESIAKKQKSNVTWKEVVVLPKPSVSFIQPSKNKRRDVERQSKEEISSPADDIAITSNWGKQLVRENNGRQNNIGNTLLSGIKTAGAAGGMSMDARMFEYFQQFILGSAFLNSPVFLSSTPVPPSLGKYYVGRYLRTNYSLSIGQLWCQNYPIEPTFTLQLISSKAFETSTTSPLFDAVCASGALWIIMKQGFSPQILDVNSLQPSHAAKVLRNAMYHKNKALQLLRANIADPVKATRDDTIIAITLLRTLEAMLDDPTAVSVHTEGFEKLIMARGGVEDLDGSFLTDVVLHDTKWSMINQKKLTLPLPSRWNSIFEELTLEYVPCSVGVEYLGSRFQDPGIATMLYPELNKCLILLQRITDALEGAPSAELPEVLIPIAEHKLLIVADYTSSSGTAMLLGEPIRIAFMIFLQTAIWSILPVFALANPLVTNLYAAFVRIPYDIYPLDLRLWILLLGFYSAGVASEFKEDDWFAIALLKERTWFGERLLEEKAKFRLNEWSEVRRRVSGFMYTERAYGQAWERMWVRLAKMECCWCMGQSHRIMRDEEALQREEARLWERR